MTNTMGPSPHYNDRTRRDMLMFVRDNPGLDGNGVIERWKRVHGGGDAITLGNRLRQFEREGLVEYVPTDGTPHVGGLLGDPRPHQWQLTDAGRAFLIADGMPS